MAYLVDDYARVSPRLQRIYVYHWRAAAGNTLFDSGLLDSQGRPGRRTTASGRPSAARPACTGLWLCGTASGARARVRRYT